MVTCDSPNCSEELEGIVISFEEGDMYESEFIPDAGGSLEMHPHCAVAYIQDYM